MGAATNPLTGLVRVLTGLLVVAVAVALLHGGAEAQVNVVVVRGTPARGPYAVEAQTTLTGSLTINFVVDGKLVHQEGIPGYCLFGGDAPCATGTLGAGPHVILAQALDAGTGVLRGQGLLTVPEGAAGAQVNVGVSGDPATGPYAVEATTTLTGSLTMNFLLDGFLVHQEGIPKYCLFGGDGPCATGALGVGPHVIHVQALDAGTGARLGQGQLNVTDGAWAVTRTGRWTTLPYTMPINPIHLGLLHTGKVLVVTGSENDPSEHQEGISKAAVWNLQTGTFVVQYA